MKKIMITLGLLISMFANAQDESPARLPEFTHSVGFDAGASNGWGLSYRYWPGKIGIQINTLPYVSPKTYTVSIGITLLNTIFESEDMRFYLYYGNHWMFDKSEVYNDFDGNPYYDSTTDYETRSVWITGIGPGFEYYFADRFSWNLRFGLGYYYNDPSDWQINLDGGAGLCFRF